MHFLGTVVVRFKKSVLEPQGQAVLLSLKENHVKGVENVRVGKFIEVKLEASSEEEAEKQLQEIAELLLYNPVMEVCELSVEAQ